MKSSIYKNITFAFFIAIFLTSCANKQNIKIKDLKVYSQNPKDYVPNNINFQNQEKHAKEFIKKYFDVWDNPKFNISKEEASWAFFYKNKKMYLHNFQEASKTWFEKNIQNSNFKEFKTLNKKAITIKNSNIKVFPTTNMMFANPNKAGEGFPFDYNQNSAIKINTPILISHFSKDKAWAYIKSYFVSGWIKVNNIAFVNASFIKKFKTNSYKVAIKDKFNLYDKYFIEKISIGTIFPTKNLKILLAKKDKNHQAYIVKLPKNSYIKKFPITFNKQNVSKLSKEFINEPYAWGGAFGYRDCSSFTQDFFAPFGIFLSRNSKEQIKNGKYINLSKLKEEEKKEYILKNAKAFKSLIYLKGHIMLYIGNFKKQPLVMHNVWGVKTRIFLNKKGRNIIGKNVITSLEYGKELANYDNVNTILHKIKGIVILD